MAGKEGMGCSSWVKATCFGHDGSMTAQGHAYAIIATTQGSLAVLHGSQKGREGTERPRAFQGGDKKSPDSSSPKE